MGTCSTSTTKSPKKAEPSINNPIVSFSVNTQNSKMQTIVNQMPLSSIPESSNDQSLPTHKQVGDRYKQSQLLAIPEQSHYVPKTGNAKHQQSIQRQVLDQTIVKINGIFQSVDIDEPYPVIINGNQQRPGIYSEIFHGNKQQRATICYTADRKQVIKINESSFAEWLPPFTA